MAKKDNNTWLWIGGIIIIGLFLGPKLGLFSIYSTGYGSEVLSNYVVKAGFGQINEIGYDGDSEDEYMARLINELGTNFYSVGVMESPILLKNNVGLSSSDLVRINNDYSEEFGYTGDIVSQTLINTIDKGNDFGYDFDDLKIIVEEFEKSVDIFCEEGIEFEEDCRERTIFYSQSCDYDYDIGCTESNCVNSGGVWAGDWCNCNTEKWIDSSCNVEPTPATEIYCYNNSREVSTITGICDTIPAKLFTITNNKIKLNTLPDIISWGDEIETKLKTSELKIEITKKGNDIVVGVGNTGITQANTIESQASFIDYESEIDHSQSIDIDSDWGESITDMSNKYTTLTNNQVMVDVSDGNTFTDSKVCCKTTKVLSDTTDVDYNNVMITRCMIPIGFDSGLILKEVVDGSKCTTNVCGGFFDFD